MHTAFHFFPRVSHHHLLWPRVLSLLLQLISLDPQPSFLILGADLSRNLRQFPSDTGAALRSLFCLRIEELRVTFARERLNIARNATRARLNRQGTSKRGAIMTQRQAPLEMKSGVLEASPFGTAAKLSILRDEARSPKRAGAPRVGALGC